MGRWGKSVKFLRGFIFVWVVDRAVRKLGVRRVFSGTREVSERSRCFHRGM